ncbi:MAG: ribosome-associated translation inhibitor RaiA [Planctomycetes bacterium]|nr:ribosome-associated translation inhibitor RaiA [Planctomycetota bacterium]
MNISITARHMTVPDELKAYTEEKAERLSKYFDRVKTIEVVLNVEQERHSAEMIISATRGVTLVGHTVEKDIHAAIDLVTDKMERQLTRLKEKLRGRRARRAPSRAVKNGRTNGTAKAEVAGEAVEDGEDWL